MVSHPDIVKRTSVTSIVSSALISLTGLFAMASAFRLDDQTSSLGMFLIVVGLTLLFAGIFRLFWKSDKQVYKPTGSATKGQSLYFDQQELNKLSGMLERSDFPLSQPARTVDYGKVRLDIVRSQDAQFAAAQLFLFEPYTYSPVTPVYHFTGNCARALIAYLQKCK